MVLSLSPVLPPELRPDMILDRQHSKFKFTNKEKTMGRGELIYFNNKNFLEYMGTKHSYFTKFLFLRFLTLVSLSPYFFQHSQLSSFYHTLTRHLSFFISHTRTQPNTLQEIFVYISKTGVQIGWFYCHALRHLYGNFFAVQFM